MGGIRQIRGSERVDRLPSEYRRVQQHFYGQRRDERGEQPDVHDEGRRQRRRGGTELRRAARRRILAPHVRRPVPSDGVRSQLQMGRTHAVASSNAPSVSSVTNTGTLSQRLNAFICDTATAAAHVSYPKWEPRPTLLKFLLGQRVT